MNNQGANRCLCEQSIQQFINTDFEKQSQTGGTTFEPLRWSFLLRGFQESPPKQFPHFNKPSRDKTGEIHNQVEAAKNDSRVDWLASRWKRALPLQSQTPMLFPMGTANGLQEHNLLHYTAWPCKIRVNNIQKTWGVKTDGWSPKILLQNPWMPSTNQKEGS